MKQTVFLLLYLALLTPRLWAQADSGNPGPEGLGETDSAVRGIRLQIYKVQRIAGNRLMFLVKVYAGPDAATSTQLGFVPVMPDLIPAGHTAYDYNPKPFTLVPATLTEETSQARFASVPPLQGTAALPPEVYTTLRQKDAIYLSIQFPAPPPPPPVDGIVPPQTVSLQLNGAKHSIDKIVIPPPPGAPGASPTATP